MGTFVIMVFVYIAYHISGIANKTTSKGLPWV